MSRIRISATCALLAVGAWSASAAADANKGKVVFQSNNCATCHNASSPAKKIGPGLQALFKRDKLSNGKKVSDATVRAQIEQGGNGMPGYKDVLGENEKNDLLAYLKTL